MTDNSREYRSYIDNRLVAGEISTRTYEKGIMVTLAGDQHTYVDWKRRQDSSVLFELRINDVTFISSGVKLYYVGLEATRDEDVIIILDLRFDA